MENPKLRTKLNLQKDEVLLKIRIRRRILIKAKFSAIIVINLDILLMKDQKTKEANIAHEGDLDAVLLMAATCEERYLDSGCSNHMITHILHHKESG